MSNTSFNYFVGFFFSYWEKALIIYKMIYMHAYFHAYLFLNIYMNAHTFVCLKIKMYKNRHSISTLFPVCLLLHWQYFHQLHFLQIYACEPFRQIGINIELNFSWLSWLQILLLFAFRLHLVSCLLSYLFPPTPAFCNPSGPRSGTVRALALKDKQQR